MRYDVITIFPEFVLDAMQVGILGRAAKRGIVKTHAWNPRHYSPYPRGQVDDKPYGGGAGMLLMPEPLANTFRAIPRAPSSLSIYLSPRGKTMDQSLLHDLARYEQIILLAGRYEGVDQRIVDDRIDLEVSIGNYVLTGGEVPALALMDGVARLLPGVLDNAASLKEESFHKASWVEYPQFTRPRSFEGKEVPEVLLSGDPKKIKAWQEKQATHQNEAPDPPDKALPDTHADKDR